MLDPTPWLGGGELLLSTGMALAGSEQAEQREFLRRLAAHGIAALGFGTGFSHAGMPPALLAEARELGFALFEVPYELPFIAITEHAFERLISEQYETLRRITQIHSRLERLLLEGGGLNEVVAAVATAIGGTAGVLSANGEALAWHGEALVPATGVAEGDLPPSALALAVPAREAVWLVGIGAKDLTDFERLVLQGSASIVGLELMRLRVQRDTERRLAGDVLAEILTGRLDPAETCARLEPFGIGSSAAVLVFSLDDPGGCEAALDRTLQRLDAAGLVVSRGQLLCAVVDSTAGDPIELARTARGELGAPARAAASRIAPTSELRRSFHEARCALEAVRFANGTAPEVASHVDLGAFELLLASRDDDALRSFAHGVLGSIEEADKGYGDELMRSLDAFIEHNGHWERAAAVLPCHRHTLRYRIRRAEQLTGRDLGQARDRIEFWLALRARELVR